MCVYVFQWSVQSEKSSEEGSRVCATVHLSCHDEARGRLAKCKAGGGGKRCGCGPLPACAGTRHTGTHLQAVTSLVTANRHSSARGSLCLLF